MLQGVAVAPANLCASCCHASSRSCFLFPAASLLWGWLTALSCFDRVLEGLACCKGWRVGGRQVKLRSCRWISAFACWSRSVCKGSKAYESYGISHDDLVHDRVKYCTQLSDQLLLHLSRGTAGGIQRFSDVGAADPKQCRPPQRLPALTAVSAAAFVSNFPSETMSSTKAALVTGLSCFCVEALVAKQRTPAARGS